MHSNVYSENNTKHKRDLAYWAVWLSGLAQHSIYLFEIFHAEFTIIMTTIYINWRTIDELHLKQLNELFIKLIQLYKYTRQYIFTPLLIVFLTLGLLFCSAINKCFKHKCHYGPTWCKKTMINIILFFIIIEFYNTKL